jgi:hypothetical protein
MQANVKRRAEKERKGEREGKRSRGGERECERQEENSKTKKPREEQRFSITEYLTTLKLTANAQNSLLANGASFHRCLSCYPFPSFGFLWRETLLLVG